jgi:restriction system protein
MASYNVSIPEVISEQVDVSSIYQNYNVKGNPTSWGVDLELDELKLFKTLKSTETHILLCKLENTLDAWAKKYQRHLDILHKEKRASDVDSLNAQAQKDLSVLYNILNHTLDIDDTVDWYSIKRKDSFRNHPNDLFDNKKAPTFIKFDKTGKPIHFANAKRPNEPTLAGVKSNYSFIAKLFKGKTIQEDLKKQHASWKALMSKKSKEDGNRKELFEHTCKVHEQLLTDFEDEKRADNEALDNLKARYHESDPKAVEEYCDIVLSSSQYPDCFPSNWSLEYRHDSRMVIVEMDLPAPDILPAVESYKYVKSKDEVTEKYISEAAKKKLFDSVVYQVCIRTLHEILEADAVDAIDAVAFNGVVTSRNAATGVMESKIILSVSADKQAFLGFDLVNVDPKATFKHLRGISAASLHGLTPIPPVIRLEKTDKRFVEGRSVDVDESMNLAAMHWEDFEHLIRELFEKEFASNGGEVHVTQASSDGGVDAIAFDPDPIRGGKIVIQAKRYTNVVGVAAVRDLYGTVMNEGATKGILVTTSNYGKDSFEFAKDKPLTLLNGNNLLSLLEKNGHKARIDIAEAKKFLNA